MLIITAKINGNEVANEFTSPNKANLYMNFCISSKIEFAVTYPKPQTDGKKPA